MKSVLNNSVAAQRNIDGVIGIDSLPREDDAPVAAEINDGMIWIALKDGRVIGTPLNWYPMLEEGNPEQLAHMDLLDDMICWPDLDECLSIQGMLQGKPSIIWTRGEWEDTAERLKRKHGIPRPKKPGRQPRAAGIAPVTEKG